jgi:hypothetical protein
MKNFDLDNFVIVLGVVIGFSIFMGSCAFMVYNTNKNYYDAYHKCIESGGSAIPGNSQIICIKK